MSAQDSRVEDLYLRLVQAEQFHNNGDSLALAAESKGVTARQLRAFIAAGGAASVDAADLGPISESRGGK